MSLSAKYKSNDLLAITDVVILTNDRIITCKYKHKALVAFTCVSNT